jgi:hypothetical protein
LELEESFENNTTAFKKIVKEFKFNPLRQNKVNKNES